MSAVLAVMVWFALGGSDTFGSHQERWALPDGDTVEILTQINQYSASYVFNGKQIKAEHYLLIQFRSTLTDTARDQRDVRAIMRVVCRFADSAGYRRMNIQPTNAFMFDVFKFSVHHWATVDPGGRCQLDEER